MTDLGHMTSLTLFRPDIRWSLETVIGGEKRASIPAPRPLPYPIARLGSASDAFDHTPDKQQLGQAEGKAPRLISMLKSANCRA